MRLSKKPRGTPKTAMVVQRINGTHEEKVVAVIEELLDFARANGATGFQFIIEIPGRRAPLEGVVGRFRTDPSRLIGELFVVTSKLVRIASDRIDP